jgi:glycosyltransferase involved in cell wall biosynthesis
MRVGFYLPAPLPGSGGHRTILRHAAALAARGDDVTCWLEGGGGFKESVEIAGTLWDCEGMRFKQHWPDRAAVDVLVATAAFTAEPVHLCRGPSAKAYFVQDFEASFNPMGSAYMASVLSYDLPLRTISIGRWLAHRLYIEHGHRTASTPFGVEHDVYATADRDPTPGPSVCVVFQPEKPRRMTELVSKALARLNDLVPGVTIYLYGSAWHPGLDFPHTWLGLLEEEALAELYRRCWVGLAASATNPSRIPFEMMASGLPVVDLFSYSTLFDYPDDVVTLAFPGAESIAVALARRLGDASQRRRIGSAGIQFASPLTLESEARHFISHLDDVMAGIETAAWEPPTPLRGSIGCVVAAADEEIAGPYIARQWRAATAEQPVTE